MKKLSLFFLIILILLFSSTFSSSSWYYSSVGGGGLSYTSVDFLVDPDGWDSEDWITLDSSSKVSWVDLDRSHDARTHKDYGAGYFDGDLTFKFDIVFNNADDNWCMVAPWALMNEEEDLENLTGDAVAVIVQYHRDADKYFIRLRIWEDGAEADTDYVDWTVTTLTPGTRYYIKAARDDDAGANSTGQWTVTIRTGSHGGSLIDTLTADCGAGEQNDYQLVNFPNNFNSGNPGNDIDGDVQDMEFVEEIE